MKKQLKQTEKELTRFLKQNHFSFDELFTYFSNVQFPEWEEASLEWDSLNREDLQLEYLPDPLGEEYYHQATIRLSSLLKDYLPPFNLYCLLHEILPLPRGLYRYREKEHALEMISEPSAKLLKKVEDLRKAPATFLISLSRYRGENWGGQRYLLPALVNLGRMIERWSGKVTLNVQYQFDGNEIIKRLDLSSPILLLIHINSLDPNHQTTHPFKL